MAATSFGVNHPLAVKAWSKKLTAEALKETWFSKFIGSSDSSLIQTKTETQKSAGDKVTFGLRVQLTGDGVLGDGTLEGNEEALVTYNDALMIDQLRHAVRSSGKMSEQRVPFSVREEGMSGLRDWWSNRWDTAFFNQLCGYTPATDLRFTGMNATVAPDATHYITAKGAGNDEDIGSADKFTLSLIDYAVERANTISPMMRPLRVGGESKYVMFLHDYQVTDLRTNTSTGQWLDIQKAAMQGGKVGDNPIYTGALGEYNGVILHKANRITPGVNSATGAAISTVRRAVLCGAQAGVIGFGQDGGPGKMSWVEELFDYENQLGVSAGAIFGIKKTRYNSKDFGTIVVSSYASAHGG